MDDGGRLLADLEVAGVGRGALIGLCLRVEVGVGLASGDGTWATATADPVAVVRTLEEAVRPRWVWWTNDTAAVLIAGGLRVATCWDVAAVHRLLFGGWRADPASAWARLHGLDSGDIPAMGQLDLLGPAVDEGDDFEDPVRPDHHLRPEWVSGGWGDNPARLSRWAATALAASRQQQLLLAELGERAETTARSESAAELLCAELSVEGLPVDRHAAERLIAEHIGARPRDEREAAALRSGRDRAVLEHAVASNDIDLRNPAHVRTLLNRAGISVVDTRAWRLESLRAANPLVDALLHWRKAERIATTYGYSWLDERIGPDGRLRGMWSGSDGAAGRMTAQAGLHNMPAELRGAVVAELGHVFVRADLGQIEPRVLAAVSGDAQLADATAADDMYAPVAARLGVERSVAKVAVLAAMYGQTSGAAGRALHGLEAAYPVAMQYLRDADHAGQAGHDLRTYGGRLIRMWATPDVDPSAEQRAAVASRGRYARNAVVQGAAAELFKAWAVIVRARTARFGARIVMCLHDELLVHVPTEHAEAVAALLHSCLDEAVSRWAPRPSGPGGPRGLNGSVRFVADVSIIRRWSEAAH